MLSKVINFTEAWLTCNTAGVANEMLCKLNLFKIKKIITNFRVVFFFRKKDTKGQANAKFKAACFFSHLQGIVSMNKNLFKDKMLYQKLKFSFFEPNIVKCEGHLKVKITWLHS